MQTSFPMLEPRAQAAIKPLDIVDTQNQTRFEFAIDRLEREVLSYITVQAATGQILSSRHIKDLFFHAKKAVRK